MNNELKGRVSPDTAAMDQPLFTFREIIALLGAVLVNHRLEMVQVPLKTIGKQLDESDWKWDYKVENGVITLTKQT